MPISHMIHGRVPFTIDNVETSRSRQREGNARKHDADREPCINLHVQKCLDAGNSPAEILEAASVAVMMQGGPAYTHIPVAMEALEALAPKN